MQQEAQAAQEREARNVNAEQSKYEKVWAHDAYRTVAPGEYHVERFIELARPGTGHVVADFGAGTGRAAARLALDHNLSVCAVDFASGCLDEGVRKHLGERFRFLQHDLAAPLNESFDFGFCTDVLEHVPTKDVAVVVRNIINAADRVYFNISTQPDVMGALIGEPLHLTVRDPFWWHDLLRSLSFNISWSQYDDHSASFYGSVLLDPAKMLEDSDVNASIERIRSNILANLRLGLNEVCPHQVQPDAYPILLAGGPSLNDFEREIVERAADGAPIITVNGTYQWALDRGIKPGAHFMVDAREFNERFITQIVPSCRYIFGSQCAHEAVVKVPREQAWIYHSGGNDLIKDCFDEYCREIGATKEWYPVYGGTTVVTRAITALLMLGFRNLEVFGWDSCLRDGEHHAYAQPENDDKSVIAVQVDGKEFHCHPWMAIQAHEFTDLLDKIYSRIDDFRLSVRGDGLIASILKDYARKAGE